MRRSFGRMVLWTAAIGLIIGVSFGAGAFYGRSSKPAPSPVAAANPSNNASPGSFNVVTKGDGPPAGGAPVIITGP